METPRRFGSFRVSGSLGQGGMGVVYEAVHQETGERVALKAVRSCQAPLVETVRREIQVLASLEHPGIVRILEGGVEDGMPWYAMPLLQGTTLAEHVVGLFPDPDTSSGLTHRWTPPSAPPADETAVLAAGRAGEAPVASPREVAARVPAAGGALGATLTLVRRLCSPLRYLHGEGLVHRDLKPGNVLVTPDGHPVLIDFGLISRFTGLESRDALERGGMASGTLGYMAPEQLRGDFVDARADLYALGCILFELVTGRKPFVAETTSGLISQHLSAPAPLASDLASGVPPELDDLIGRLLAKEPGQRIGYADDVARALAAIGARDGGPPAPEPRLYLYRPRLAGRGRELSLLEERLDGLKRGAPSLVLVSGESGVGKTRLLAELTRAAAARDVEVILENAAVDGAVPLHGALGALRLMGDWCHEKGAEETARLFGPRARLLASYEPTLEQLPGLASYPEPRELPPSDARLRIIHYAADAVVKLASERPLLMILDDAQWSDELTLAMVRHLRLHMQATPLPLMLVLASRQEEPRSELEELASQEGVQSLSLGRVEVADVGSIVKDMLALSVVPEAFSRFLGEQSLGNPFFVAEYLRTAVEAGVLHRDDAGTWQLGRGGGDPAEQTYEDLPLPRALHDLVSRHVESLDPMARALLESAAVMGRESPVDILAEVVGARSDLLARALQELRRRHMLESDGSVVTFGHDKVREAVYGQLEDPGKARLHRRAAEAIESGPVAPASQGELGRHWELGGDPLRAHGCYLLGADRAAARHALADAERLYRAALRCGEDRGNVAVRHRLARDVLFVQGRYQEAHAEERHALEQAVAGGSERDEAACLQLLGRLQNRLGASVEAQVLCERARRLFQELDDRRGEAEALETLGTICIEQGRSREARSLLDAAHEKARLTGDGALEGRILRSMATTAIAVSDADEAVRLTQAALELHRRHGDRRAEGIALGMLGNLRRDQGRLAEADELYRGGLAVAREVGDRRFEGMWLGCLAVIASEMGRERAPLIEGALRISRETRDRGLEAVWLLNLGTFEKDFGRSCKLLEESLAIGRALGDRHVVCAALEGLAGWETAEARFDEAQGRLDEAVALADAIGHSGIRSKCRAARAHATLLATGDHELVLRQVEEAQRILEDDVRGTYGVATLCVRGHAELAAGLPAKETVARARRLATEMGAGPESYPVNCVARLERAAARAEAGLPLVSGHDPADITPALRDWLAAHRPSALP